MLMDKGANIEIHVNDVNGESPLQLAVQRWGNAPEEEFKIIQELLAQKVTTQQTIERKNNKGYTALHSALLLQSDCFSTFLLEQGADVDIATEDGSTSLHLAVQWPGCRDNLLLLILKSTNELNAINQNGKTALHCALESQSSIACKMLLEMEDNDVNIVTADGEIALHLAAKWPGIGAELFTTLLGKTTEINRPDSKGRTPLHCALLFKSVTATEILLNESAIVNAEAQEFDKFTATHLVVFWSSIPINLFEIILGKPEANLDAQDNYGRTALHCAILSKSETLIDKLLNAKAKATIPEKFDRLIPLHRAAMWRLEYQYSPSPETLQNQGRYLNQYEMPRYQLLSNYKLDENVPDISRELFKKILENSNVNEKSSRGETALHFALASHSENATGALLNHPYLDVNIKGRDGQMAIHIAAKWQSIPLPLFQEIIKRTAQKGNLNQKYLGKTALDCAQDSKLPQKLINLLQQAMDDQQ
jgi:ankyrin repeat protein